MKKILLGIFVAACVSLPAAAQFEPATTGYSPTTGFSAPEVRYQLPPGMTPTEYHRIQNGAYYYRNSGWRGHYYNPYNYYYNQGYYYNNQGYADPNTYQNQQQNYYRSYNNNPWSQSPAGMSPSTPGWREPSIFSK